MNKELQININLEDGSYTAKYNPKNTSNQKAIECLKEVKRHLCSHTIERSGYEMICCETNYVFKLIDDKIKELEKEQ